MPWDYDNMINAVLVVLLPTNAVDSRRLFYIACVILTSAYVVVKKYDGMGTTLLHTMYYSLTFILLTKFAPNFGPRTPEDWENPAVIQRMRLATHSAALRFIATEDAARAHACCTELRSQHTTNVVCLDSNWMFQFTEDPVAAKTLAWSRIDDKDPQWVSIRVPSNWQLSTKFDKPIYTNVKYVNTEA